MTNSVRLVVFDLAGTTVDDGAQVVTAFVTALRPHGVTPGADEIAAVRGTSKRDAISRLLPPGPNHEDHLTAAYAAFQRELLAAYAKTPVTPIDGALDLFDRLRRGFSKSSSIKNLTYFPVVKEAARLRFPNGPRFSAFL